MELELKHLSAYFPYGLKALVSDLRFGIGDPFLDKITGIYEDLVTFNDSPDWYFDSDENDTEIKLALRPLSDLTKEIEHNGEKFIPTNILNDYDNGGVAFECDVNRYGKWYIAFFYADGLDSFSFSDFEIIREKLLEWNFDIFGLIEQGKAIDINNLNNEKTNNIL